MTETDYWFWVPAILLLSLLAFLVFFIVTDKIGARNLKKKKMYTRTIKCRNCKKDNYMIIPYGTSVRQMLADRNCKQCNNPLKRSIL